MIHLDAVDKHFRSAHRTLHVIDHVTLTIPKGSFFTFVGPSGSGKTTILRLLAGLERHDDGRILFGSRVVSDPHRGIFVPASDRGIGMVFQSYAIWPHMDVFDNVAYPLRQLRQRPSRAEMINWVGEVLDLVGLKEVIHAPAPLLSGGQQQRVALARALVGRPDVLSLDEPLSNLDAQLRERMRLEIRDIQRSLGITTVYVTHDRAEALSMSTTVAVVNHGRIEMIGTPSEVYERPKTLFTAEFLGQCNVFAGKVSELLSGGHARVDTAHGRLLCLVPPGCVVGQAMQVVLRPEDVTPTALDRTPKDDNVRQGKLTQTTYYGERVDCVVELPGGSIRGYARRTIAPCQDKMVAVIFAPERLWAIPTKESDA